MAILWELGVEPLRTFVHLIRLPLEHLPWEIVRAGPTERRRWGRSRAPWRNYMSFGQGTLQDTIGGVGKPCRKKSNALFNLLPS